MSVCSANIEDRRCDGPNRFAAGVHEAEARRRRSDKDSPVRQGVDASGRIGSAIGHAPFVAQAAPVPGEQETSLLGVIDCAGREQRLAVGRPCDLRKSVLRRARRSSGLCPPTRVEGRSIQNIDRRDVVVADRQPFAVRTESDAARAISARRLEPARRRGESLGCRCSGRTCRGESVRHRPSSRDGRRARTPRHSYRLRIGRRGMPRSNPCPGRRPAGHCRRRAWRRGSGHPARM